MMVFMTVIMLGMFVLFMMVLFMLMLCMMMLFMLVAVVVVKAGKRQFSFFSLRIWVALGLYICLLCVTCEKYPCRRLV